MLLKCRKTLKPIGTVQQTQKTTISVNFNTENFDALKTRRINQSRP